MPIINLTKDPSYPVVLSLAGSFFSRLVGLLGTAEKGQESLHIVPCNSIHTFGMKYPVDILFLDRAESVVKMISCMKPNRTACSPPSVHSVIELPAGYI